MKIYNGHSFVNVHKTSNKNKKAFTIVELLVVIVVIGILAAITIVSYSGISRRAIAVSLQNDLDSASKLLKMYNVEHGYYPNTLDANDCPATPDIDNRYCLKASSGNDFSYTGGGQAFTLIEENIASSMIYQITDSSSPIAIAVVGSEMSTNTFVKAWGGKSYDSGYSISDTSDGGFIIAGGTESFGAGSRDAYVSKYTADGTLSWSKTWGGTGWDFADSIKQTSDGGYIVTGGTWYGAGSGDMFIAKFTPDGVLSWNRTWGGISIDESNSVIQTYDDGYVLVGETCDFSAGDGDLVMIKYDSSGNFLWNKMWGGTEAEYADSVVQTSDNGLVVSGQTNSYGSGGTDAFIIKFNSMGDLSWSKTWGGTEDDYAYSVSPASDDGLMLVGETRSYGAGGSDAFVAKFNSIGDLSWSKTWGGTGDDYADTVTTTSDGGFAIVGETSSFGVGDIDVYVAKYNLGGTLSWNDTIGGKYRDYGFSIAQISDNSIVITGSTESYSDTNTDEFTAKISLSGAINNCPSSTCMSQVAEVSNISATTTSVSSILRSPSASRTTPSATVMVPNAKIEIIAQ